MWFMCLFVCYLWFIWCLTGRPIGLFSALDSACLMPQATPSSYVFNVFSLHSTHRCLTNISRVKSTPKSSFKGGKSTKLTPKSTPTSHFCLSTSTSPAVATNNYSASNSKNNYDSEGFCLQHYAGVVEYNVHDFLNKNRDTQDKATADLFYSSTLYAWLRYIRFIYQYTVPYSTQVHY